METLTNIVNTATTTVSNAIYGADPAKATNETAGKEPVSGQTGKGTVDEPYDQGNSESALAKNTPATTSTGIEPTHEVEPTGSIQKPADLLDAYKKEAGDSTTSSTGAGIEPTRTVEPTGSIQKPEDLIKAYNKEAGDSTSTATGSGSTATGITDKAGATLPASEKDTLWRGVDAYKDSSSTGVTSTEPTSTGVTSTSTTTPSADLTRLTSGESTSGPKGAVDAEPKNYSIGDLTSGKETPPKPVGNDSTNTTSKTGETAISPPDMSTTSPGSKPDYTPDTHKASQETAGLVGEKAGHGGPQSAQAGSHANQSSSPSRDDDEKGSKLHGLKDKLKNKLHIGSKDH